MNMRVDHMQFLDPVVSVMTPGDLGIPNSPPSAKDGQLYDVREGDQYLIYTADKRGCGHFNVLRWHEQNSGRKQVELQNMRANTHLYLDTWQIGHLERNGLIRPLVVAREGQAPKKDIPGSGLALPQNQRTKAQRYLDYLNAIDQELADFNDGLPSRKLAELAVKRLAEERGEKPPAMSVIYQKREALRANRHFDPILAVAPKPPAGNLDPHFDERTEEAIRKAVEAAWSDPKGSWLSVKKLLDEWSSEGGEYADLGNLVRMQGLNPAKVSDRTIQRRLAVVDLYTRDLLRFDREYAERAHAVRVRQERPTRPLEIVDVDHTTLGVVVYDHERGIGFGRPDLVLFRDRFSGIPLGWAISFGPPSYETFLEGLLHAMLPKNDLDLPVGVTYPWHGRPTMLGVDNAKHLIGMPIREAAMELGFQITPYRPGRPWEKGALEHLFHILNIQLVDRLPGATTMSPSERKKFGEEKLKAVPHISIAELNGYLAYYFSQVYNVTSHEGLGELFTFHGVPKDLWEDGIKNAPLRPIQDRDILVRLAGEACTVTVQEDGVRWDYLVYQSEALRRLSTNPAHKYGTRQHGATEYKATRDPANLDRLWVHNPYTGDMIEVPICPAHAAYATGLRAYQHRRIKEHNKEKKRAADVASFTISARELERELLDVHQKRRKHSTAAALARFISGEGRKLSRSAPVEMGAESATGRMDYADPAKPDPVRGQVIQFPGRDPEPEGSLVVIEGEVEAPVETATDIDTIRNKFEDWED